MNFYRNVTKTMQASIIIKALDSLGYSKEIVEKRSWIGKKISKGSTIFHQRKYGGNVDVIFVLRCFKGKLLRVLLWGISSVLLWF